LARTRTTKKLAQRIDLNYFKRPTPLKRAKLWLSILAPVVALAWILFHFFIGDPRVYSSGRLSEPHAVLEKQCTVCHVQAAGSFSAETSDKACLSCHDGPAHHPANAKQLACAECHTEHRGRINIAATSNQACANCHGDLRALAGASHFANSIRTFSDGHPEFAALGSSNNSPASDPGTIRLNHSLHMKPIRQGPTGPTVQLDCGNCHRPTLVDPDLTYSDSKYRAAETVYKESDEFLSIPAGLLSPPKRVSGREFMAPVRFANACASCHLLTFDKRFTEGVPHDKPEVVHEFLVKKFTAYIAAHPAELHEVQEPSRSLSGKPPANRSQSLTPSQWVAQKTAVAEELLWRKSCAQCHTIKGATLQDTSLARWTTTASDSAARTAAMNSPSPLPPSALPSVAPANLTLRWLPHAKFDHDAHRGFSCGGCHQKALTSVESSDILVPGIATCQTCHAPGPDHAESRCFECHTYHDWSKRKEVKPSFTLPALRTGGR